LFPLLSNTELILGLWLKEVPEYAVIFTQLVLLNCLADSLNLPMTASALATGKIRKYELVLSAITLINIPVSYFVLKAGAPPYAAMIIAIAISCVSVVVRAFLLKGMIGFPVKPYFVIALKVFVVTALMVLGIKLIIQGRVVGIGSLILYACIIEIVLIGFYAIIIGRSDRKYIIGIIRNRIGKK
jgi:hypothetical protein